MAKFCGNIGFACRQETKPDVWEEIVVERKYFGDILKNFSQVRPSGHLNDDIEVSNTLSIIADPYISNNLQSIRYVVFMGTKWKVSNIEVQYPRLLLSFGGVYNS